MSFKFEVNFENDCLQAKAKNSRSNLKDKSLCHEFKIADLTDQNTITVLPGKVFLDFLFGPGCERLKLLFTRVISTPAVFLVLANLAENGHNHQVEQR